MLFLSGFFLGSKNDPLPRTFTFQQHTEEICFAGLKPAEDAEDSCLQMINCSGPLIHCFAVSPLNKGLQHSCDVLLNRNCQTPEHNIVLQTQP